MLLIFIFVCGFAAGVASLLVYAMVLMAADADRRIGKVKR